MLRSPSIRPMKDKAERIGWEYRSNRLPAPCPDFGYDGLEGVAGGAASAAFLQLASGYLTSLEDVDPLRSALFAYCHRITPLW